jgi:hypothetical protein
MYGLEGLRAPFLASRGLFLALLLMVTNFHSNRIVPSKNST